uniref:Uncharacterized protein n=1 Tax=Arundo donax TaxID=35708 RepID=A0A0A9FJ35_ARUDO
MHRDKRNTRWTLLQVLTRKHVFQDRSLMYQNSGFKYVIWNKHLIKY